MTVIRKIVHNSASTSIDLDDYLGQHGDFLVDQDAGQVRFMDGTTPGGLIIGNDLVGFTTSLNITPPNDTTNASVLAASGGSASADLILLPSGQGAFCLSLATGDSFGGNKRGSYAVDLQNFASGKNSPTQIASGSYSFATNVANTASGNYSHAIGWYNTASGDASHAEGYNCSATSWAAHAEGINTSSGNSASHSEGTETSATGNFSHAEGNTTTASGDNSHSEGISSNASGTTSHAEGNATVASGDNSHAQGISTTASGNGSHAEGVNTIADGVVSHASGQNSSTRGIYAFQVYSTGQFAAMGDQQTGRLGLKGNSVDATQLSLTCDASSPGTMNQITVPPNATILAQGTVIARDPATGHSAAYKFVGLIKNVSGSVTLVGSPVITSLFVDSAASSWALTLAADSVNLAISVRVTGAASTSIFWTAEICTQEVIA